MSLGEPISWGWQMSEDKHNCIITFQAATCIAFANILLAQSSHMSNPKEKGKGHTICLIVEDIHCCTGRGAKCREE